MINEAGTGQCLILGVNKQFTRKYKLETIRKDKPGAKPLKLSNTEDTSRQDGLLSQGECLFAELAPSLSTVRSQSDRVCIIGCKKRRTNPASATDQCASCLRNCRLETTPAYSMRYLWCHKTTLTLPPIGLHALSRLLYVYSTTGRLLFICASGMQKTQPRKHFTFQILAILNTGYSSEVYTRYIKPHSCKVFFLTPCRVTISRSRAF